MTPAWAAESGPADGAALVGGFGLGDGLEGSIDEPSGAFKFGMPAGGLNLGWDSRAMGTDPHGLGEGWSFGLARLQVDGGVRVFPASGGSYAVDASSPSGLDTYTLADVRFESTPGVLPAEGDRPEIAYAYSLHELGGSNTYFNETGDPVALVNGTGGRTHWTWEPGHRLVEVVDPDGVVTSLTWSREEIVIRPGANLPGGGEAWVLELMDDRVVAAVDPEGGRTQVLSDPWSGLVLEVAGEAGARTTVEWRTHDDGVTRAQRVATFGVDGAELSARTWQPAGTGALSSGWPAVDAGASALGAAFAAKVGDGHSELESSYNALGSLVSRVMSGSTASGRQVLQEQTFEYPGTDQGGELTGPVEQLPKQWANPSAATITFRDAAGGERSGTEHSEFDEFGRLVKRTAADGMVSSFEYDPGEPDSVMPPVGLRVAERMVAPDGSVSETKYELNEQGTAVVAETGFAGREGEPLVQLGRVEYTVEDDGFVSERREFPAPTAESPKVQPRVASWRKEVDLSAGVLRLSETIGAGTELETSTSSTSSLVHDRVLAQTDELGNTSTATYDRMGRVVSASDAAGRQITSSYETAGHDGRNATTVTGPDGVATTEVSDEFGRIVEITDNIRDGEVEPGFERVVESREYPVPGQVRVTDAWGAVSSKRVDVFGRTVDAVAPTGLHSVTVHNDVAGTATTGLTPSGDLADALTTSTAVTDQAGRVTEQVGTRADGVPVPEVGQVYDGFGRPLQTTGGPLETSTTYDEYGRPIEQTLTPAGDDVGSSASSADEVGPMTVSHEFDAYGTAVKRTVTDAVGSYSGAEHDLDALGRTTAKTDQAGITSRSEFTPDGLVRSMATTTGHEVRMEYDGTTRALVRATTTAPSGELIGREYVTDPITGQITSVFDPADRANTEITYTYDAFGNVRTVTYPDGKQIEYHYDAHGRRVAVTDTADATTRYAYDSAGILTGVTQTDAHDTLLASVTYSYDEFGRLIQAVRGNGVTTAYEYNAVNGLTREITTTHGAVTADRSYTYDAVGRLTERTDRTTDPAGPGGGLTATTTAYSYDSFDRLTGSAVHDGDTTAAPVTKTTQYVNTVAGDIERETVTTDPGTPDEITTARVFEYDPAGALTAISTTGPEGTTRAVQEYDVNGNLTRDVDGTTYTYDAESRVIGHTTTSGVTTRIGYWADDSRKHLTTSTPDGQEVTTGFYWDGGTLLNDTHTSATGSDETVTASYLIGTSRHARTLTTGTGETVAAATSYLGTDRHGNTTDLTDEHGAMSAAYDYSDYGVATITETAETEALTGAARSAARNPFQYAAAYADAAGTLHLDVRDYRPHTMRFDTPDSANELTNYAYGDLNPIMKADPSGRSAIGDQLVNGALIVFGLVAGIAAGVALGLPTGGMSLAATAWYVTAAVAIAGDLVSTGIAVAQIIDTAGPRFIRDQDRESLRISGIVIGAVAGFVSGAATYMYRARRAADAAGAIAAVEPEAAPVNSFSHHKSVKGTIMDLRGRIQKNLDTIEFHGSSAVDDWGYNAHYKKINDFYLSVYQKKKPSLSSIPKPRWFNGKGLLKREELKSTEQWLQHWDETLSKHRDGMTDALENVDAFAKWLEFGDPGLKGLARRHTVQAESGRGLSIASKAIQDDLDEAIEWIEVLRQRRIDRDATKDQIAGLEELLASLK